LRFCKVNFCSGTLYWLKKYSAVYIAAVVVKILCFVLVARKVALRTDFYLPPVLPLLSAEWRKAEIFAAADGVFHVFIHAVICLCQLKVKAFNYAVKYIYHPEVLHHSHGTGVVLHLLFIVFEQRTVQTGVQHGRKSRCGVCGKHAARKYSHAVRGHLLQSFRENFVRIYVKIH